MNPMLIPNAFNAMQYARVKHAGQIRKYTGNPYHDHLAEVAGIVATVTRERQGVTTETMIAVAWLHDTIEDTETHAADLYRFFGPHIAEGVQWLTDVPNPDLNRAARKAVSRARLAQAPGWVQTIKCADLISNTSSIVQHDPKFAVTYLAEKRALLEVMTSADPRLMQVAKDLTS